MKTSIYCLKDTLFISDANFRKGNIYKMELDEETTSPTPMTIIDHSGCIYDFHPDSPFKKQYFPQHFIELKEYRKQKLTKILSIEK